MPTESENERDPFIDRLANVLRAPERFDDSFEERLVAEIRRDPQSTRASRRSWWTSPWLHLSPIASLAAAAALVAVASLGASRFIGPTNAPTSAPPSATVAVAHDTVTLVRFVFVGQAKSVAVVGDFNSWGGTPIHLTATGANDAWTASVPLPNGRHEYAFIVDGKRWVPDPFAPAHRDEFDATSSVITVGD